MKARRGISSSTCRAAARSSVAPPGWSAPLYVLSNGGGLGYGYFELDAASRRYLVEHIEDIGDRTDTRQRLGDVVGQHARERHQSGVPARHRGACAGPRAGRAERAADPELRRPHLLALPAAGGLGGACASGSKRPSARVWDGPARRVRRRHGSTPFATPSPLPRACRGWSGSGGARSACQASPWPNRTRLRWLWNWRSARCPAGPRCSRRSSTAPRTPIGRHGSRSSMPASVGRPSRARTRLRAVSRRREPAPRGVGSRIVAVPQSPATSPARSAVRAARPRHAAGDPRTGDIFFPSRWTESTLWGHSSLEVASTVRAFLAAHPSLPTRLRWTLLSAADELFRSSSLQRRATAQGNPRPAGPPTSRRPSPPGL